MQILFRVLMSSLLISFACTAYAEDQRSDPKLNALVTVQVKETPGRDGNTLFSYTLNNGSQIAIVGFVIGRHWDTRASVIALDESKFSYSEETGYPAKNVISPLNWFARINRAHESLTGFIEWQNQGQPYDIKAGSSLSGFAVKDLSTTRDVYMTAPWTAYFANASIATGYVTTGKAGFFPKRPADAVVKTISGVLVKYEITSASGSIGIADSKTGVTTAFYTGSPMQVENKNITCAKPQTPDCKDWPKSIVIGKTPVTVSYWLYDQKNFGDTYKIATDISVAK